jgi:hypothetical protein
MSREELHKMIDELPEDMLPLVAKVLNEALNEDNQQVAWDHRTYAFMLEDEDGWWEKPIEGEAK